ncbi:peptidase S8 and S53, subtilisin, kexin, sedolisin [Saccharophagus degradans 2-40]|uniref:Peptidase S8 and S53, subtilisin, kexin, sedolisin n=1 Tax=Saccharophagus degradans (strain 2-40 / ATCC 43961 / DSM 17024) TaxID=203122 RepID=Q21MM1_SACD2|nr:peptidase S8 and S53, subtilisin, kexin, sedolisin [Saccharophagus degradans 2-40]
MLCSLNRFLILLFVVSALGASPLHASVKVGEFKNFDAVLTLEELGNQYQIGEHNTVVKVTNRLVVKARRGIDAKALINISPHIINPVTIFEMQYSKYWLVGISDVNLLGIVITELESHAGIELVQPDLLQISRKTSRADISREKKIDEHYFSALGLGAESARGRGVNVAVIDDGVDLAHPALAKTDVRFSYDTESRSLMAKPVLIEDTHGTKVAGVIFSRSDTFSGLAPNASLISIRQPSSWTSETLLSFYLAKLNNADVINCSWHTQLLLEPIADVVNDLAAFGRQGRGAVVVFAAGNDGVVIGPGMTEASIDSAFVVGASDIYGRPKKFSNTGKSVDFYVYGGRYKTTAVEGGDTYFSGTSLSAAIVSGLTASLLSDNPELSLSQISKKLSALSKVND